MAQKMARNGTKQQQPEINNPACNNYLVFAVSFSTENTNNNNNILLGTETWWEAVQGDLTTFKHALVTHIRC